MVTNLLMLPAGILSRCNVRMDFCLSEFVTLVLSLCGAWLLLIHPKTWRRAFSLAAPPSPWACSSSLSLERRLGASSGPDTIICGLWHGWPKTGQTGDSLFCLRQIIILLIQSRSRKSVHTFPSSCRFHVLCWRHINASKCYLNRNFFFHSHSRENMFFTLHIPIQEFLAHMKVCEMNKINLHYISQAVFLFLPHCAWQPELLFNIR